MKLEWEVSRVGHLPFLRGDRLIVAKSPYNNVHVCTCTLRQEFWMVFGGGGRCEKVMDLFVVGWEMEV